MIEEDFVSVEIAKLLEEKGFNESCDYYYDQSSDEPQQLTLDEMYYSYDKFIKAPTLQMAVKWLRVVHNILLFLLPEQENGKLSYFVEVWTWNKKEGIYERTNTCMPRKEPTQAFEAGLKYSLKHLI